uniref:Uncharacterized protein n=1 Tax=Steinernema glaseri TaxID=37863 RepID=A0A1I8AK68_9BILA
MLCSIILCQQRSEINIFFGYTFFVPLKHSGLANTWLHGYMAPPRHSGSCYANISLHQTMLDDHWKTLHVLHVEELGFEANQLLRANNSLHIPRASSRRSHVEDAELPRLVVLRRKTRGLAPTNFNLADCAKGERLPIILAVSYASRSQSRR